MTALVEAAHVSTRYRTQAEIIDALADVSLEIEAGQLVLLHGASGSGKTTLINVIAGLLKPDEGKVLVSGAELTSMSESDRASARLQDIGVIFQDHNLIPEFTALENVALPLRALGERWAQAVDEAQKMLVEVGLGELGGRHPAQLSGGQRQRVGVARALCGGKKVLLADEPTGSLDQKNARGIFQLFRVLAETGIAVIVASHDDIAKEYADVVFEMRDGRLMDPRMSPAG